MPQSGNGQVKAHRSGQMVSPKIHGHEAALPRAKPNPRSRRLKRKVRKTLTLPIFFDGLEAVVRSRQLITRGEPEEVINWKRSFALT